MLNPIRSAVRRGLGFFGQGGPSIRYGKTAGGILAPDHFARPMERKDDPTAPEIKTLEDLKSLFLTYHRELKAAVDKANKEAKDAGTVSAETKSLISSLTETLNTLGTRLDKVEAKGNRETEDPSSRKSLGEQFAESKEMETVRAMNGGKVRWKTKSIINATGQNQPLVPQMNVPGIQQQIPNRRLRIRQLLTTGNTTSNLVQYVQENVFTNNAGPQAGGSPTVAGEGQIKNESDITFQLKNAAVATIAHWIQASRQVLDDAPMLASYINGRLLYGLALEEEDELLNGDGTAGTLQGLMPQATPYNRAQTGTKLDWIRRAITQLQLSEYDAEFLVLNPVDWEDIELTKDTQGRYIIANPQSMLGPQIWSLPVVATNSMTAGNFLVANGTMAAQIWDRQDAAVQLSTEDRDNFIRNMVTILAEERLALTVYRPSALIKGVFTV